MKTLHFKVVFLLLITISLEAIDVNTFRPDFYQLQSGGNLGYHSIGIGYKFGKSEFYETEFAYGYTPKNQGGSNISQFNWKNRFKLTEMDFVGSTILSPFLGIHVITNTNTAKNRWITIPEKYPHRYYFPTAIHGILALGTKLELPISSKHFSKLDLIMEFSSLDTYIRSYFISDFEIPFDELWTFSLGIGVSY